MNEKLMWDYPLFYERVFFFFIKEAGVDTLGHWGVVYS